MKRRVGTDRAPRLLLRANSANGWSSAVQPRQARSRFGSPTQARRSTTALDYAKDARCGTLRTSLPRSISGRASSDGRKRTRRRPTAWRARNWLAGSRRFTRGWRACDATIHGRLLNARFGLSWGLAWVMHVQRGVLSASDNAFYDDVVGMVCPESQWARLLSRAFGIAEDGESASLSLHEEVRAGLLLFCETFDLLKVATPRQDYALIEATVFLIGTELAGKLPGNFHDRRWEP